MGSGFGIQGLSSLKNNKNLFKRKNRTIELTAEKVPFVDTKTASPELLEEIRNKIVREQKIRRRRVLVTTLVIAAIIIGALIYVMNR